MAGLLITKKLIAKVREMRDGNWFEVCREQRFVSNPISASVAKRIVKLGWAEKQTQWSLNHKVPPTTLIRLNEVGVERAKEFDNLSEINSR